MDNNNNNQNSQGGTDQTGTNNNSGNNTGNNNQNNTQQQNTQQQNNQNTGGTGAQGKMFTQEDVSRMMTNEKNQGRAAAFREMGIDPNDTNTMNMFKAFMQAMQPAQQNDNQVAQQQIKIAEAESRAKKAEAKAEAMQLGVDPQYVDDAVVIIMSKLDDKTDVKTLVGELKVKYPVWFKNSNEGNNNQNSQNQNNNQQNNQNTGNNTNDQQGQNGTGSSVGNSNNSGRNNKASGIGARLAAQRKVSSPKTSFWS